LSRLAEYWIRLEPFWNRKPALLNRFGSLTGADILSFFNALQAKDSGKNMHPPPPCAV
jgi:hypothetical protein